MALDLSSQLIAQTQLSTLGDLSAKMAKLTAAKQTIVSQKAAVTSLAQSVANVPSPPEITAAMTDALISSNADLAAAAGGASDFVELVEGCDYLKNNPAIKSAMQMMNSAKSELTDLADSVAGGIADGASAAAAGLSSMMETASAMVEEQVDSLMDSIGDSIGDALSAIELPDFPGLSLDMLPEFQLGDALAKMEAMYESLGVEAMLKDVGDIMSCLEGPMAAYLPVDITAYKNEFLAITDEMGIGDDGKIDTGAILTTAGVPAAAQEQAAATATTASEAKATVTAYELKVQSEPTTDYQGELKDYNIAVGPEPQGPADPQYHPPTEPPKVVPDQAAQKNYYAELGLTYGQYKASNYEVKKLPQLDPKSLRSDIATEMILLGVNMADAYNSSHPDNQIKFSYDGDNFYRNDITQWELRKYEKKGNTFVLMADNPRVAGDGTGWGLAPYLEERATLFHKDWQTVYDYIKENGIT